jgi:CheY-like chemotaxis protein
VKYGALSVDTGHVEISWAILPAGGLELRWIETGGRPVREPASAGFGSTLVKEVATRQLGGSLDISWPPSGMRLVAVLPLTVHRPDASGHTAPASEPTPAPVKRHGRGRLLVVEDESLIAMAVCQDLASLGWSIIGPAATIDEARRLLEEDVLPDAAVLDVNLAGQPVYPLAEWLQSKQVPFVFCSGYEQLEDHPTYEAWARVRKPVDIHALDRELRRAREAA